MNRLRGRVFRRALLWLAACLPALPALAAAPDSSGVESKDRVRLWPPRLHVGDLVYVPKLYYSSETSFGIGGQLVHPFRLPGTSMAIHGSDIRVKGRATFKGQGKVEARTALLWNEGRHALNFKLGYDSIPLRFYGIGQQSSRDDEEVYRPQTVYGYVELLNRAFGNFRFGLRYEFERFQILESEGGGKIELRDGAASNALGAGLLIDYDTRDSRYSPSSGTYWQAFGLLFDEELGSDHDFNNYNFDLRNYVTLAPGHVLATQVFVYMAKGAPPFWRYAALGGRMHSRGYRQGRYLDRVLVATQAEYRAPLWRRTGYAVFGGIAQVAPALQHLNTGDFKPTVGGEFRFQPSPKSPLKVHLSLAFGREAPRIDLAVDESF